MKRVWITGVGGMMGSHLIEMLSDNYEVFGTYYKPTTDLTEIKKYALREVNITDWCSVFDFLQYFKPDSIFHLAAQSYLGVSWERPAETITTNVIGMVNICESVRRLELKPCILAACTAAEYGYVPENEMPIKEDRELKPLQPYGVSKMAQDFLAYQYHQNYGMNTIRARIFNCTGTRKINDALSDFIRRAVDLERNIDQNILRVGNLDTRRTIVDVRDLNNALVSLMENGKSGEVYNVGGDTVYVMKDIVELILTKSKRKNIVVKQDSSLLRSTDESIIWGDTTRLKNDTQWRQTVTIEQTIEDMFSYWRNKDFSL